MEKASIVIIGGGVVGLAIAARLSEKHENIVLLERHESFGRETSSRNSEVIHASVYYPANFLKGKLCLRGNEMLYDICREYNIPHSNCGKLIVATDKATREQLPELYGRAKKNGAKGVRLVDKSEINKIEPNIRAEEALFCPTSGIVDSHSLMQHFEAEAINNGAAVVYGYEVCNIDKKPDSFIITSKDAKGDTDSIETRIVINSAGLNSDNIAKLAGIDIDKAGYKINYHKGIYYRVNKKTNLFPNALIYPVPPEEGSVGIHTCPDTSGGMRLGPHFIWTNNLDYSVQDIYHDMFFDAASRYLPFLEYNDITVDSSGFMSAVQTPGEPMRDFIINHEHERGLEGLINLIGIESPGLTSSPAIAEMVENMIDEI